MALVAELMQQHEQHTVAGTNVEHALARAQALSNFAEAVDTSAEYILQLGVFRIEQLAGAAQLERATIDLISRKGVDRGFTHVGRSERLRISPHSRPVIQAKSNPSV